MQRVRDAMLCYKSCPTTRWDRDVHYVGTVALIL